MLGLDNYGSESEGEKEQQSTRPQHSLGLAPGTPKSSIRLPPPSSNGPTAPQASLPVPKAKRAPKKFTIGLPALPKDDDKEKDDLELDRPAAKRQKTGTSSLLSMLPAPKQNTPSTRQSERVLGGGKGPGLIFHVKSNPAPTASSAVTEKGDEDDEDEGEGSAEISTRGLASPTTVKGASSLPFLPPSLVKGKANISVEDKPGLPAKPPLQSKSADPSTAFSSTDNQTSTPSSSSTTKSSFSIPPLSSAPAIPTFEPPVPTPQDPYPGYYQLPSGGWAAYDPAYYEGFRKNWQTEYDAYVRKLEKGAIKGFEGYEEGASEVDAMKEMEKTKLEVREREEKKALTKGATGPAAQPNMKFNPSKFSGIAKSRHQLSTLLRDAYENREALEERIAEGRRNRKEAGNKYGF